MWDEAVEYLNFIREKFINVFGQPVWRTLEIFLSYAAAERTTARPREAGKTLARLLAQRGVSLQQARADKRKLRDVMVQALEAKNPLVVELVEKLRAGGRTIFEDLTFVNGANSSQCNKEEIEPHRTIFELFFGRKGQNDRVRHLIITGSEHTSRLLGCFITVIGCISIKVK